MPFFWAVFYLHFLAELPLAHLNELKPQGLQASRVFATVGRGNLTVISASDDLLVLQKACTPLANLLESMPTPLTSRGIPATDTASDKNKTVNS